MQNRTTPEPTPIGEILKKSEPASYQIDDAQLSPQDEPYILTPEEAETVIYNEKKRLIEHKRYSMLRGFNTEEEIKKVIDETDWDKLIDEKDLLKRANANKHHDIWHKGTLQREREFHARQQKELREYWTANRFYNLMKRNCEQYYMKKYPSKPTPHFIVNENTQPLIRLICFYLSRDERFEKEFKDASTGKPLSFSKGLILRGNTGLGKTSLLKWVSDNPYRPVTTISLLTITDAIRSNGSYNLPEINGILNLDDLGTEVTDVKHYGTEISWFSNFIELCYLNDLPMGNMVISTNLNWGQILDKYGARTESRMKQEFNVVDIFGEDLRKK